MMKQVFGGFMAVCTVLGCGSANAACGDAGGCQTVRMTPGTPQVVSNTFTMGGGCSTGGCVTTSVNPNTRYVVGTPVASSGYVQRGYVSTQPTYYRQPTSYQRTNYVAQPNGTVANTRTAMYQQSRTSGETGGTSGAYVYNKGGSGYVGMSLDVNLLNWTNKYKATPEESIVNIMADHDDYRFKPLIGGHIVAGYRFNPGWRADIEGGFTSEFEDSDNGITFKLSVPYVTANIYHDFTNGLYLGIGGGAAFPTISMEWENFTANNSSKTGASLMGAAMLGYAYYLSENLILDVRGRFAGFDGARIKRDTIFQAQNHQPLESLETKVGFIMDNSISIGLKYEF